MKRKLDNSSKYPCNKCDEAFQSKWKLKNHLKRIHSSHCFVAIIVAKSLKVCKICTDTSMKNTTRNIIADSVTSCQEQSSERY